MDWKTESDVVLWKQAAVGKSEDACVALIDRHRSIVWSVCSQLLLCHDDREEAFQMTFICLMEQGDRIRSADFGPWLYRVAYRAAIQVRRETARKVPQGEESESAATQQSTFEGIESADRAEQIATAVDRLPGKHREVLILHYVQGLSREAIAGLLGTTLQTIKGRLSQARNRLRRDLVSKGITLAAVAAFLTDESKAELPDSVQSALQQQLRAWQQGVPVDLSRLHYSDLTGKDFGMYLGTKMMSRSAGTVCCILMMMAAYYAGRAQSGAGTELLAAETEPSLNGSFAVQPIQDEAEQPSIQLVSFASDDQQEEPKPAKLEKPAVKEPEPKILPNPVATVPTIEPVLPAPSPASLPSQRVGEPATPVLDAQPPTAQVPISPYPVNPYPVQPARSPYTRRLPTPVQSRRDPNFTPVVPATVQEANRRPTASNVARPPADAPPQRGLPNGTWTRQTAWGSTTSMVNGNQLRLTLKSIQLQGMEFQARAEYSVASDGTVYGLVHSVDGDLPTGAGAEDGGEILMLLNSLTDLPFSLRCHADGDSVSIKSFSIGLPVSLPGEDETALPELASFAQMMILGTYRQEAVNPAASYRSR